MDNMTQPLRKKKFRFALITLLSLLLVTAIVTFAVLLAYRLPWRYDMTAQRIFTLTEQSSEILDGLTETVQIAAVYPTGQEEMMVQSLLEEYRKASDNIVVEYVDAEREPTRLAKYQLDVAAVANGTLIVKSGGRSKLIQSSALFQETAGGNVFSGEREITGAIRYVTATELPVVYFTQGHEETAPAQAMTQAVSALQLDAYEVRTTTLLQEGRVPEDCSILIMPSPKSDVTDDELAMLQDYLKNGGKLLFLVDSVMNTNSIVLTNLNTLLNNYGIDINNNFVVEEDSNSYLSTNQMYLIPGFGPHEITQKIAESKQMVILPVVRGLGSVPYDEQTVRLDILLLSSNKSWARTDMTIPAAGRTEADIGGPIPLAYAAVGSNVKWGNDPCRIVVIGNSSFAYDGNLEAQANRNLFLNSVSWLQGDRNSDIIASKQINADRLIVRGNEFVKLAIICVAVLPLLAFGAAIAVWGIRRNR